MKVKIKTGFWEVRDYSLSVEESGLMLRSEKEELYIPFSELVGFTLSGVSENPDRFTIETKNKSFEGRFAEIGEGKEFVSLISKRSGQQVEINLTQD